MTFRWSWNCCDFHQLQLHLLQKNYWGSSSGSSNNSKLAPVSAVAPAKLSGSEAPRSDFSTPALHSWARTGFGAGMLDLTVETQYSILYYIAFLN